MEMMDADTLQRILGPPACPGCLTPGAGRREAPGHLCQACAQRTEPPAVRLGKHERAILLACWDAKAAGGQGSGSWWEADCTTDALPALVCGRDGAQCWPTARGWAYDWSSAEERNRVQATLSRAIRTLYGKGLLDCGGRGDATGHGDARGGGAYIKTLRLTHAGALVAARLHETLRTKTHTES